MPGLRYGKVSVKNMEGESLYTSVFVNDREIVSDREAGDDNSLDQEHERGRDK